MIKLIRHLVNIKKTRNKILPYIHFKIKKAMRIDTSTLLPSPNIIDIVIPVARKDLDVLNVMLESLRFIKNNIGQIFIISDKNNYDLISSCKIRNVKFIDEIELLGFSKEIINYKVNGIDRSGWLFQQLLKLSSDKVVSTEYFLVLDSDTVFIKPIVFLDIYGNTLFFQSDEYHLPYFEAIKKLIPRLEPYGVSFVSHGMLFKKEILQKMKEEIGINSGKKWYEAIIELTNNNNNPSCFSEYELYANYYINNSNKYKLYPLLNISLPRRDLYNLDKYTHYSTQYTSLSFHSYNK